MFVFSKLLNFIWIDTTKIVDITSKELLFEIKETNLIASKITKCQPNAIAFMNPKDSTYFMCTVSGHIMEIAAECHIETMDNTKVIIPASLRDIQAAIWSYPRWILRQLRTVTCEISQANLVALMKSQKLNPSEILSSQLEENTYTAGTSRQFRCSKLQAILLSMLNYKSHVSNRPLFMAYISTDAILSSSWQSRFLSAQITSTITLNTQRIFSFNRSFLIH